MTTLKEQARLRYNELYDLTEIMGPLDLIYNAGWKDGEWTCCECGTMIGKNLNGDKPFLLARRHCNKHYMELVPGDRDQSQDSYRNKYKVENHV